MTQKLTQSEFTMKAQSRAKRPIDLSKFVYAGSSQKGVATCPEHGDFLISANALMNRIGCPACALKERADKRRMPVSEFINRASAVHADVYDYTNVRYTNSQGYVLIVCPTHGEFSQTPSAHLTGRGCPTCGDTKIGDKCRISQSDFLARCTDVHGDRYDLSRVAYKGVSKKIEVVCKEHGVFYPTAGNFTANKSGCPTCARLLVGSKSRMSEQSYIERAKALHSNRFEYGEISYKKGGPFLSVVCKEHGRFEQRLHDHMKGVGCVKCSKPVHDSTSFAQVAVGVHGGKYDYKVSTYTDSQTKIEITCPTHGAFMQLPSCHVSLGHGCPRCGRTGPSSAQVEIAEFLSAYVSVSMEAPIGKSRRRLDILVPDRSIAVEYHGLIWHSTAFKLDPRDDFKKHKLAEEHGVRVLHVYEDEWASSRPVVERTLLAAIGSLPRVFARTTSVVEVDKKQSDTFFKAHHLQGAPKSKLSLGLMLGNDLVACMAFAPCRSIRRNTDARVWELQRYASICSVTGGASKLLKGFLSREMCHTLISYSDNRMFSGRMYEKLGFTLEHETPPDYSYVCTNSRMGRVHKSNFQRKHLPTRLKTFDPSKSEAVNCRENGWYQLFDCGKKKWSLACM